MSKYLKKNKLAQKKEFKKNLKTLVTIKKKKQTPKND